MILSKRRITKALIILGWCTGWSASLLFANHLSQIFSRQDPYGFKCGLPMLHLSSHSHIYYRRVYTSMVYISMEQHGTRGTVVSQSLQPKFYLHRCLSYICTPLILPLRKILGSISVQSTRNHTEQISPTSPLLFSKLHKVLITGFLEVLLLCVTLNNLFNSMNSWFYLYSFLFSV